MKPTDQQVLITPEFNEALEAITYLAANHKVHLELHTDQDGAWMLTLSAHAPSPLALDAVRRIVQEEFLENRDPRMGYLLEFHHGAIVLDYCSVTTPGGA